MAGISVNFNLQTRFLKKTSRTHGVYQKMIRHGDKYTQGALLDECSLVLNKPDERGAIELFARNVVRWLQLLAFYWNGFRRFSQISASNTEHHSTNESEFALRAPVIWIPGSGSKSYLLAISVKGLTWKSSKRTVILKVRQIYEIFLRRSPVTGVLFLSHFWVDVNSRLAFEAGPRIHRESGQADRQISPALTSRPADPRAFSESFGPTESDSRTKHLQWRFFNNQF